MTQHAASATVNLPFDVFCDALHVVAESGADGLADTLVECAAESGYVAVDIERQQKARAQVSAFEWWSLHDGHDVGSRHEDGSLYSASCHDCGTAWHRDWSKIT